MKSFLLKTWRLKISILSSALLFATLLAPTNASAIPEIQQHTLSNGVRVLLIEAHNIPMVSMQLSIPAGSRFDPEQKGGTASLLAEMLTDHTARHDDQQWALWLDQEALRIGSGANRDMLTLSLSTLKESLGQGANAFSEALLEPGWRKDRFDLLKKNDISAAIKNQEDPGTQTAEATAKLLYPNHPYGHRASGNVQSLDKITLKDLQQLYRQQVKPEGSVIAISGDITMNEAVQLLEPRLKHWLGKPAVAADQIAQPTVVRGQSVEVNMPTSQSLLQYSRLGMARDNPDFFALFVTNHLLGGGGFGSLLMEEVREKRGLVYGAYSYFIPLLASGPFVITLQTKASQAEQADQVVRQLMQDVQHGKISKKRLSDSKKNLIGSFAQRMDSNRERVGLIAMIGFYNLPLDYLQSWQENVSAVTLAKVKKIAHDWLELDDWNRVLTGPGPRKAP